MNPGESTGGQSVPCFRWLCPFITQVLDFMHAVQNRLACGKTLLGEGDPGLPLWEARIRVVLAAPSLDAAIHELLDRRWRMVPGA